MYVHVYLHVWLLLLVDCGELLNQVLVSGGSLADKMRPFTESNMMSECSTCMFSNICVIHHLLQYY